MAKNFLNDIRPANHNDKKSRIDDEELVEKTTRSMKLPPRFKEKTFEPANFRTRKPRKVLWFVVLIVIIIAVISVASYFSSAKVEVIQKTETISLENANFNATLAGDNGTLSFKLVKLSASAEKVITGGTPTPVSSKATGKVVIYNNFSTVPQKLAIDTRLSSTDGKIYKTDIATTVPGMKTEAGKQIPGSVEVGIHADQPGSAYNSALTDFTIIGFKGTPKYAKFSVRSKTIISGGASGTGIALSEADAKVAHEAALGILTEKLVTQAKTSLPESSILLDGAYIIREDPDSGQTVADKNVMIVKGSIYGILFDESELSEMIAIKEIPQFTDADISIPELETFAISLANPETISDTTTTITFTMTGEGHVAWVVPTSKVISDLAGSKKKEVSSLLAKQPSIDKASVKVTPFWAMNLPKKTSSISLKVIDPDIKK
ncbi:MAG: hypothetical protein RL641_72 [Candidatus Parcubacteria bacterium]|jgi:hypothetical protein